MTLCRVENTILKRVTVLEINLGKSPFANENWFGHWSWRSVDEYVFYRAELPKMSSIFVKSLHVSSQSGRPLSLHLAREDVSLADASTAKHLQVQHWRKLICFGAGRIYDDQD